MKIRVYKAETAGHWYVRFPLGSLWAFPSWDRAVKFALANALHLLQPIH